MPITHMSLKDSRYEVRVWLADSRPRGEKDRLREPPRVRVDVHVELERKPETYRHDSVENF